ncbi:hypothetical protein [Fusibacter ferrireducens]|uniref:Uncharacterized protein n=1 Tax=Fusibacter ferrireducens TaxID=2785058 RepID=A0ABR9ZNJ2_9FIRM|nr:hypothetical protein [Fusibacter ferrireducens]MBF4692032.1 hypothetical protein [Fusibacter ferrireducens]
MVNETLKPMIKPFPILLKSQFAIEILTHYKGQSMISWPLMDLIYLLMQEAASDEQSAAIQTIIENNPMIYNAHNTVHVNRQYIQNSDARKPINVIHQQLQLINTLINTEHLNPIINHQEVQKLIDLNMSLYPVKQFAHSISQSEVGNKYIDRYTIKYLGARTESQNSKSQTLDKSDTNMENGVDIPPYKYNPNAPEYGQIMLHQDANYFKNNYGHNNIAGLNAYAKLYAINDDIHVFETSTSEPHFFSKLINRLLGRNQKSVPLNSENHATERYTQWSAVQLLTATEVSMPLAHYINQTSNRFIYRSYADHKRELFYDEVNSHIQSPKWLNIFKQDQVVRMDTSNKMLKNKYFITPNDTLIKNEHFLKMQLNAHENRMNRMFQYPVNREMYNQEISSKINDDSHLTANSNLNYEINSDNLNYLNILNTLDALDTLDTLNKLNTLYSTQKKNSRFLNSMIKSVQNNIQVNDIVNIDNLNSPLKTNTRIETNAFTKAKGYTNSNLSIFNHPSFLEKNRALVATHLLRTREGLYHIDIQENWMDSPYEGYEKYEENALYRSLNLINRQMLLKEQFVNNDAQIHQTVINNKVIENTFIDHMDNPNKMPYSRLYSVQNINVQSGNTQNSDTQKNHIQNVNTQSSNTLNNYTRNRFTQSTYSNDSVGYDAHTTSIENIFNSRVNEEHSTAMAHSVNMRSQSANMLSQSINMHSKSDSMYSQSNIHSQSTNIYSQTTGMYYQLDLDSNASSNAVTNTNSEYGDLYNSNPKNNAIYQKQFYTNYPTKIFTNLGPYGPTNQWTDEPVSEDYFSNSALMVYQIHHNNLNSNFQGALRHILLSTLETVSRFDNLETVSLNSRETVFNESVQRLADGSIESSNNSMLSFTGDSINSLQKIKAFNAFYTNTIIEKKNALENLEAFSQKILNRFSSIGDEKIDNQIKYYLEHLESLKFLSQGRYQDAQEYIKLRESTVDLKRNLSPTDLSQSSSQPMNIPLSLYQSINSENWAQHTILPANLFLTHRLHNLNHLSRDDRSEAQFKLTSTSSIDYMISSTTQVTNGPQSLIHLAASLVNQSNRFLEQHHFYYKNRFQANKDSFLQTEIREDESNNFTLKKSILNPRYEHKSTQTDSNQMFSDKVFSSQMNSNYAISKQAISNQNTLNPSVFVEASHHQVILNSIAPENAFKHTFKQTFRHTFNMLYRFEPIAIQSSGLSLKSNRLINPKVQAKRRSVPNSKPRAIFISESREEAVSVFNLKKIIDSKPFIANLEHKQFQWIKGILTNVHLYSDYSKTLYNTVISSDIEKEVLYENSATKHSSFPLHKRHLINNQRIKQLTEQLVNQTTVHKLSPITIDAQLDTVVNVKTNLKPKMVSSYQVIQLSSMNRKTMNSNYNSQNRDHYNCYPIHISDHGDFINYADRNVVNSNHAHHNYNQIHDININNIYSNHINRASIDNSHKSDYNTDEFSHNISSNNLRPIRLIKTNNNIKETQNHVIKTHNSMSINPKIITLKLNHPTFNPDQSSPDHTHYFSSKWQNTVILKNGDESIKLTLNTSYLRQRIAPIKQTESSSVDYTHEISLLMAELENTQMSSDKIKGRKQKKAARKNAEKRKAIEREIEHIKFQSKLQQQRQKKVHNQYPELVPAYVYQSLAEVHKKLDHALIVQRQLHYKNQFVKSKDENKQGLNLSEKTVQTISNYAEHMKKSMNHTKVLHNMKTVSLNNNRVQMSTYLLQKQTPVNLTHHTDQVMSYSEVESSRLSHKTVTREVIREVMTAPEMTSVLPKDHQESAQVVENTVAPSPETINIDKIADQVYKRVTDRVERERRRRGL